MAGISPSTSRYGPHLNNLRKQSENAERALERLSTGKRINRPADDPAGFVAAEEIRGEIVRMTAELKKIRGQRNLGRIEQSGLAAIRSQLNELRGLLTEAAGDVLTDDQRSLYDAQIAESLQAIDQIEARTKELTVKYGGPSAGAVQVGVPRVGEPRESTAAQGTIEETAAAVDARLDSVTFSSAAIAAHEKYELDIQENLLTDSIVIHSEALSQIEDTDFAEESANLASAQILSQGALAAIEFASHSYLEQMQSLLEEVTIDEAPAA